MIYSIQSMPKELKSTKENQEKAVLVTVGEESKCGEWQIEDREKELKSLVKASGAIIADTIIFRRRKITPNLFVGKGNIQKIAELAEEADADVVIFNNDLSPSQQKNIEEILDIKTIDRTQLILDIFARRANSNEGKVQRIDISFGTNQAFQRKDHSAFRKDL